MDELIKILQKIGSELNKECVYVGYPRFIKKNEVDLEGYQKQESDLSPFEYEYVSQHCGQAGDNWHGFMMYPYKDIFIQIAFEC